MARESAFQPNWASPPGDTIADILNEENLSVKEFTQRIECSSEYTRKLLKGNASITLEIARKLEFTLGASKSFWMNREAQYREDIARLQDDAQERKEWLRKLPLKDMIKFGWVARSATTEEKEAACLRFFGVTNVKEWYRRYHDLLMVAAFRTSSSFDSQPESVITWLRQGEIESASIRCKPWNAQRFHETLLQIRALTRKKDPQEFIPELQKRLAECGVTVVVVPAPTKCHASGATYFISPKKALLLLSFRHLSDDHFWFSLFHEAGHLLLHGSKRLFLEDVDKCSTVEEEEANNFAAKTLIPAEFQSELRTLNARNWRKIVRFAKNIGISSGIVVGQLQHLDIVGHNQLNKLKKRFRWTSTST